MKTQKWQSALEYIDTLDPIVKNKLLELREFILKISPKITEGISYNMPVYKINKPIIYFYAYKNHIGIYPHNEPIMYFSKELEQFKTSKGAIQIKNTDRLPFELIKKIVLYNIDKLNEK